jgi:hypothetical protein
MRKYFILYFVLCLCSVLYARDKKTDVYLLIGQSNMAGRGYLTAKDSVPMEGVWLLNAQNEPEVAVGPLNKYSTIRKDLSMQQVGPGESFGETIHQMTGRKVLLVVNARGGSSVTEWQKGLPSHYYADALARTKAAMKYGTLKAIIWHQGESDVKRWKDYPQFFSRMIEQFRKDLDMPNLPVFVGQIGQWNWADSVNINLFNNQALPEICRKVNHCYMVSSNGLVRRGKVKDPHFSRDSQIILGKRYADAVLSVLYPSLLKYKVFQFQDDQVPSIDGSTNDWNCVPDSYALTEHDMKEDEGKHNAPDASTLAMKVKVGWNEKTQHLYFLYEATDNYWRFLENSLNTDIFEVVVDGDCSGGPFIDRFHPTAPKDVWQAWFNFHGCHAQNYHIFTPPHGRDWCMYWGPQVWLKKKPFSDYAYNYSFKEGEGGKLILEFYITPYDYAAADGPEFSRPTILREGNDIGLSWAVIDWDGNPSSKDGFWNLSDQHTMYGNADFLRHFVLMPIGK